MSDEITLEQQAEMAGLCVGFVRAIMDSEPHTGDCRRPHFLIQHGVYACDCDRQDRLALRLGGMMASYGMHLLRGYPTETFHPFRGGKW